MKILMAWEMGANFGHAAKLVKLARAILARERTAEIVFAVKQPGAVLQFASELDFRLLPAPFSPFAKVSGCDRFSPVKLYSDDLWCCGYHSPEVLAGLLRSWSDLFELVEPDLLVTQAAPTALIAARPFAFRKVTYGHCYDIPPLAEPMPPLRYWEDEDPRELAAREAAVLAVINGALEALDRPGIGSFAQALETDAQYLTTYRELDHYPRREDIEGSAASYYGAMFTAGEGRVLRWRSSAEKRIFAYIRPSTPGFTECLQALQTLAPAADVIVSSPGIPGELKIQVEKPHLRIVDGPVNLAAILPDCDIGICHAPQGTTCAFAWYGVRQLLLPGHIEQYMGARAVGRQGLGLALWGRYGPDKVLELMRMLFENPRFSRAAADFSAKYRTSNPETTADTIAGDMLAQTHSGGSSRPGAARTEMNPA